MRWPRAAAPPVCDASARLWLAGTPEEGGRAELWQLAVGVESGPLGCLFAFLRGPFEPVGPARDLLCRFISEVLEPLLEQNWLAVGLAPLRP